LCDVLLGNPFPEQRQNSIKERQDKNDKNFKRFEIEQELDFCWTSAVKTDD